MWRVSRALGRLTTFLVAGTQVFDAGGDHAPTTAPYASAEPGAHGRGATDAVAGLGEVVVDAPGAGVCADGRRRPGGLC